MIRITRCWLLAALGLLANGCGDPDEAAREDIKLSEDALELLRYVPADTPYLMAALEPMPKNVMAKLEPAIDSILPLYGEMLASLYRQLESESTPAELSAEDRARAEAVLDEIVSILSVDGLDHVESHRVRDAAQEAQKWLING